jgi:hypothetical protein
VPPALSLDDNGNPEILHVLSEETIETHGYYYVRFVDGEWQNTRITSSNHQWNSGYLKRDKKGHLHAYVIVGEGYQDKEGINYSHGGGRIEHWLSKDQGNTWDRHRDITPDSDKYPGWSDGASITSSPYYARMEAPLTACSCFTDGWTASTRTPWLSSSTNRIAEQPDDQSNATHPASLARGVLRCGRQ